MDKPITANNLVGLYELYINHSEQSDEWNTRFGLFLGWLRRIQQDNHEGAGHCHHCKLAGALLNSPAKPKEGQVK